MQDLNDFYYFVKTVEYGGFAPAGRALGLPKSKLSRRISALEERLGVTLIYRTTRQFNVTEIGHTFLGHCKAMLVEAEAAKEAIEFAHAEPCGTIKVVCPIALLHVHIGPALAEFMSQYPKVNVQLEGTNRKVDLVAEGIDVAVRVRPAPFENSDLVLKVLSEQDMCLLASPSLIKQYGLPNNPNELSQWPSLGLGETQQQYKWTLYNSHREEIIISHQPRYITSDIIALRHAAIKGVGIVQLPSLMVAEQIKEGSLVHILPSWQPNQNIIHLVYPSRRGLLPAVRAFVDFLAKFYRLLEK